MSKKTSPGAWRYSRIVDGKDSKDEKNDKDSISDWTTISPANASGSNEQSYVKKDREKV